MKEALSTYQEVAEEFGTDRHTIRGLVHAHGLTPKRIRLNSLAKGLSAADRAVIRKALGLKAGQRLETAPSS